MTEIRILAIDPGGVHVGLAEMIEDPKDSLMGWRCKDTAEVSHDDMMSRLAKDKLGVYDALVVERFQLYPDVAMSLTGQEMWTSELIGAIRLACLQQDVSLFKQPASWQQTVQGVLRHLGLRSQAKRQKSGPHAFSAELHGWAYLMRSGVTKTDVPTINGLQENL